MIYISISNVIFHRLEGRVEFVNWSFAKTLIKRSDISWGTLSVIIKWWCAPCSWLTVLLTFSPWMEETLKADSLGVRARIGSQWFEIVEYIWNAKHLEVVISSSHSYTVCIRMLIFIVCKWQQGKLASQSNSCWSFQFSKVSQFQHRVHLLDCSSCSHCFNYSSSFALKV